MTPYLETLLPPAALRTLHRAEHLIRALPDAVGGQRLRCHEVARAAGKVLGLRVVDGLCGLVQHSWLALPEGAGERDLILDVYAVGRMPPVQLVDTFWGTLHFAQPREWKKIPHLGKRVEIPPRTGLYLPTSLRGWRYGVRIQRDVVCKLERIMRRAEGLCLTSDRPSVSYSGVGHQPPDTER